MKCEKCDWNGTVATVKQHVARCEFVLVSCSQKCKDSNGKIARILRKDFGEHLKNHCPNRNYVCRHCGEKGKYAYITHIHDQICEKKKVPCTNAECTKTMQRRMLKSHQQSCPFTEIPCQYAALGCAMKVKRKDESPHIQDDKSHLHMALDTVVKLQKERAELVEEVDRLKHVMSSRLTFEVPSNSSSFVSPHFYTKRYKMSVGVYMNADAMDYDSNGDGSGDDFSDHDYSDAADDSIDNDDGDAASHVSMFSNDDGSHGEDASFDNDSNDDVDDDQDCQCCTAVCVKLEEGDYDFEVTWPFVGEVTITLLNQLENKNHYSKTVSFKLEDSCFGGAGSRLEIPDFIRHSELAHDPVKNTQYLKDESLYFRVDAPDWKPWLQCKTV